MSFFNRFGGPAKPQPTPDTPAAHPTAELEERADEICRALGLDPVRIEARAADTAALPPDVMGYIAQGQLIQAIARYRELTNCGLKEAKDAVDAVRLGGSTPHLPRYGALQAKLDAILARVREER